VKNYQEIEKITYQPNSKDAFTFKHYNPDELIFGKPMKEHLKFAMSYWHTIDGEGADMFGPGTMDKSFGKTDPLAKYKAKADFAFELMDKLQIEYYCFHDTDIAPEGSTVQESLGFFSTMIQYIAVLQSKHHKKLLWNTANNFSDKKFMAGAATSPNADVFAVAAAKVKAGIDAAVRLNASGYVFWGGREGYDTLLNTNMELELDNLARFLTLARDYARKVGFTGMLYIEPKPKEPTKHQYDFDAATCLNFLRKYNLAQDFKLNIEANHATLAGHRCQPRRSSFGLGYRSISHQCL
jgi:xylose isomerase